MRSTTSASDARSGRLAATAAAIGVVLPLGLGLVGCAVVAVAGAAVSVAGSAVSLAGTVVATGVKVTGKVVEKTVDLIVP